MSTRLLALACSLAVLASGAGSALAAPDGVDAKRREAAALREAIARQGERLSMADEDYNEAAVELQRLGSSVEAARAQAAAAEAAYEGARAQLGERARVLYMHPGAPLEPYLGSRSIAELGRARSLAGSVLISDADLLARAQRARALLDEKAATLGRLRNAAHAKEQDLRQRRGTVQEQLAAQRALLGRVDGDVARLLAAERERRLEQARAVAAAQAVRPAPTTESGPSDRPAAPEVGRSVTPPSDPPEERDVPPPPTPKSGAAKAVQTAAAQIGKPYEWAASGPDSFDCSGLTMYAWASAGVSLPHSSRAQYSSLPKVPRDQLRPGDLVFFGTPIHHVGIYEGGGTMINAPQTGENVRRDSIARRDYVGAARP